MLGEKLDRHKTRVFLVNTGWTGGPYGIGKRMSIQHTRALISSALNGELDRVEMQPDPIFGFAVPKSCPGVPADVLNPRNTWADKNAYDEKAKHLASLFVKNFDKYRSEAPPEVIAAQPKV
jgi:phosphoenolpyruvate carboxykinase (ATP)